MLSGFGKQKKKPAGASPAQAAYWKARQAEKTDKRRALRLYEKAARLGYATAQYNCGLMYAQGEGVARSLTRARSWLEKAVSNGSKNARELLEQVNRMED